jgi:hypothetical protein
MKKRYLFVSVAKRWNNLLSKFSKLKNKLELLLTDSSQYNKLVNKLQQVFSKLEKMQYQTGIKVAGTSLAVILSAFTANAQFAAGTALIHTGNIYESGISTSDFSDIDGDGDEDLYVSNNSGAIEVFINNNGVYTKGANLQAAGIDINVSNVASPVFADIDGDGDEDLYVGRNNGNIITYTNNNGNFTVAGYLQASGNIIDVGNNAVPTFADIDGDGDLDLYVGENGGTIEVFTNNSGVFTANGVLGLTDPVPLSQVVGGPAAPTFADTDGDGDLDLYVGTNTGEIVTFTNANGFFSATGDLQSNLNLTIDHGIQSVPTFRDADNDGDLDLYLNSWSTNIFLYTNNGGVFTAAGKVQANDIPVHVDGYSSPVFADIDADGDLDLYVGNNSGQLEVFTNNNGGFTGIGNLQSIGVTSSSAPTFADIDNDGDLDLYVGSNDGTIEEFNNANGTFTSAGDLQAGGNPLDIGYYARPAFADIDGDGDLDLYVGKYEYIETFINNAGVFTSTGNLQAAGIDVTGTYRSSPTFADIDGDGDLDLYIGSDYNDISVYINTNGNFTAGANLQAGGVDIAGEYYSAPTFADVDGDGDLDLYVGNQDGNVTFYENLALATGINEVKKSLINVYPNPVQNQLFIELDNQEVTEITILDYAGRIVKTINGNATTVNVSDLTKGIYILKVTTEKGVSANRFIKQ